MEHIVDNWDVLSIEDPAELTKAFQMSHNAAQLVARCGHYLIDPRPDDGHSNMRWAPTEEILTGRIIEEKLKVGVKPSELSIVCNDPFMNEVANYPLNGKTLSHAHDWLMLQLKKHGIDPSRVKEKMHYEMPSYGFEANSKFEFYNEAHFKEIARYRANADIVLDHFAQEFDDSTPVRIWPHHFDSSSIITLEKENDKGISGLGIGYAIPDAMIAEPYFYIYGWLTDGLIEYADLPEPSEGAEWITGKWNGQILRASQIVSFDNEEEQAQSVIDFFETGLDNIQEVMGFE